jgi:mono/diheme cytochrome c family protein
MRRYIAISSLVTAALGCNALDEKGSDTGSKLFIPVDRRPVQQALSTPPPISGGTLAVSADGAFAVAADPDRDRISIVTLATAEVRHVALQPGDEPGRVAIDASARAHVALRRGGAVVRVDLASGELDARTRVCAAPRGLAHDPARDLLHVACADGRLVTLDAQGEIIKSVEFDGDLRDVMIRGDELLVSTYKSAELLALDAQGAVRSRAQARRSEVLIQRDPFGQDPELQPMQPHLAWRSVQSVDGGVWMLHQQASEAEVDIDSEPSAGAASPYGGGEGGAFGCQGIVQSAVTEIGAHGGRRSLAIAGGVLAVDLARSPVTGSLAVALPGTADPEAPRPTVVFDGDGSGAAAPSRGPSFPGSGGQVAIFDGPHMGAIDPALDQDLGCAFPQGVAFERAAQPTAVAFTPAGALVVQSREPALLIVIDAPPVGRQTQIELGGDSVRDTGHDVFHRDAGAGIACASCHGEGGDDGHTWLFSGIGARRTQAVNIGLEGTAPFHWDGDMHDLETLLTEVFVGRMGGVHQSEERLSALAGWLFAQKPPAPIVDAADPAAARGKALFESAEVGCTGCHNGEALTDNRSYDVGTGEHAGERLQVPSLRGIGYRAPFIHNGCAETLRDRFDPGCGGDKHGNTAGLGDEQIDDLVAYLRSL